MLLTVEMILCWCILVDSIHDTLIQMMIQCVHILTMMTTDNDGGSDGDDDDYDANAGLPSLQQLWV